ncbi:phage tail protein [Pseudoduganella chitinolytica]|uniref:Phage tail protein n=1 Tax=Pseudoduganella chitinolytica TaxID=34070 RepID=A0ABY8BH55_9BURK|nr:phage tail protein [Pseudoduganella chitinolytica]WEF34303.1 phage tail protein [Pseudoduganella chitinolytica]
MSDDVGNLAAKAAEMAAGLLAGAGAPAAPPLAPAIPPPPPGGPPGGKAYVPSRATGGGGAITAEQLRARKEGLQQYHPGNAMPRAYSFRVVFGEKNLSNDASFQEVSGIGATMETEAVQEGGENRYVLQLPKGVQHGPLVLKRGVGASNSALVRWCRATLEGGLGLQVMTAPLTVYLLDPGLEPLRAWLFANAYPTKWEASAFDANKNEVAIETISLVYTFCNRIL